MTMQLFRRQLTASPKIRRFCVGASSKDKLHLGCGIDHTLIIQVQKCATVFISIMFEFSMHYPSIILVVTPSLTHVLLHNCMRVQPQELPVRILMYIIVACSDKFAVQGGREAWLGSDASIHHRNNGQRGTS